jgi:hypothetical protein
VDCLRGAFPPGRCRPVNGPPSAAVNSRQSHTAAHWLPALAGDSLPHFSQFFNIYLIAYFFISWASPSAMSLQVATQVAAFNHSLTHSLSSLTHSAQLSSAQSLTQGAAILITHLLTHSLTHSLSSAQLTQLTQLTHPLTPLTHSLTHSVIHSFPWAIRSSSGFKHNAMFHPDWFLRSPLLRSVADFITGVRYFYNAAMLASWWSRIRISLSRVAPGPRAFALLCSHLKDGAP